MKCEIKTWMYEAIFVFVVLGGVAYFSGNEIKERIVCFAILFTFMHAQVADRMQAKESIQSIPHVHCYKRSNRFFS